MPSVLNAANSGRGRTLDISIVIPSYNRGLRVRETVERCLCLRPGPREIILVDDHSNAEDEQILRRLEGGIVKYIRMPENGGQAAARSMGFATARGKYIVSLDDDSWFLDDDALQRVTMRFAALPDCGILAFRTFAAHEKIEPAEDRLWHVSDHITCGAAYRAETLHQTGYHLNFLRYEGEEADLSLKIIGAGFDVVRDNYIRVYHDYNPAHRSQRTMTRVREFGVRNDLLRAWIYFPFDIAVALTFWRAISHILFGVRRGYVLATLTGLLAFVGRFPQALLYSRPLRRGAALKYLRLRRNPLPYS